MLMVKAATTILTQAAVAVAVKLVRPTLAVVMRVALQGQLMVTSSVRAAVRVLPQAAVLVVLQFMKLPVALVDRMARTEELVARPLDILPRGLELLAELAVPHCQGTALLLGLT
jgi:hypothetical protein